MRDRVEHSGYDADTNIPKVVNQYFTDFAAHVRTNSDQSGVIEPKEELGTLLTTKQTFTPTGTIKQAVMTFWGASTAKVLWIGLGGTTLNDAVIANKRRPLLPGDTLVLSFPDVANQPSDVNYALDVLDSGANLSIVVLT